MTMIFDPNHLATAITAIGALGTASAGLVDASKTMPGGGISHAGFAFIERAISPFAGNVAMKDAPGSIGRLYDTLHANWVNGVALPDQKAIAKSLIKVRLTKSNAEAFGRAASADVDFKLLERVAEKMNDGQKLETAEVNALGRFDLALTSLLDAAYQHADQRYRNQAKLLASAVSVVLAVLGGAATTDAKEAAYWVYGNPDLWQWVLAGLLATPLAPMAKDLASAVQAGAKAATALRSKS